MSLMEKIFGAKVQNTSVPPANGQSGLQGNQPMQQQAPTNNLMTNQPPQTPHQSSGTAANGVVPSGGNEGGNQSPADKFADLWEPVKQDESKANEQSTGLTPEKMLEAASKVDFKRVLDQESLAKIKAGGDDAVQALAELLNKTAQTVYGQSTVVAQKLMEAQEERLKAEFIKQVPGLVKKHSMRDSFLAENPAFKKPSVAPVVEAIQSQLAVKFPNATASELNVLAKEYLQNAASDFAPVPKKTLTAAEAAEVDWDEYMKTPENS